MIKPKCDRLVPLRIGILTYHRVVNLGSLVQAACMVELARHLFPESLVELIDYRPRVMALRELRKTVRLRPPSLNVRHISRQNTLTKFLSEGVPLSQQSLTTDNTVVAMEWLCEQHYDVVLVGSDTVWELRAGAYSPGGVNLFFLPGNLGARKVAVAASMDPLGKLTEAQQAVLRERVQALKDFDVLAVRDATTYEALVEYGADAERVIQIPDPTLMVGLNSLADGVPPFQAGSSQAIGVSLPRKLAVAAHRTLKELGYEVWDWNGVRSPHVDRVVPPDCSPTEVLALHREVSGFVTDRFHGSIFCMAQGKGPVLFFESPTKWPLPNSKGRDLFALLGLEHLVFRAAEKLADGRWMQRQLTEQKLCEDDLIERIRTVGAEGVRRLVHELQSSEII